MSERLIGQDGDDRRTPDQRLLAAERMFFLDIEMSRVGVRLMRQSGLNFNAVTERARRSGDPGNAGGGMARKST